VALLRCLPCHRSVKLEGDEQIGVDIVKRAIESPLALAGATPASKARSSCRKSSAAKATKVTTSPPANTKTSSKPASLTRRKSPAALAERGLHRGVAADDRMPRHDVFQMFEGPHSARVHETMDHLLSPELRPALRDWYRRCGIELNPAAIHFREQLNQLAGEHLETSEDIFSIHHERTSRSRAQPDLPIK
jgi:hypothetical protein